MKGRVLVVERDPSGRAMMKRALESAGFSADGVTAGVEAEEALGRGLYSIAIVDELAGGGSVLEEVRSMRSHWPKVEVIATGTLLSQRILIELMRLGVVDALVKPFLPQDLREAVQRAQARMVGDDGRDFAAALAQARSAVIAGDLARARSGLARAHGVAPLDPDVVALDALVSELEGDDARADRLYRVALVLRDDEASRPPDPHEGLARLDAYRGAPIVSELPADVRVTKFSVGIGGQRVQYRRDGERGFAIALGEEHVTKDKER